MFQLAICRDFIARHYLIGGDWGKENQLHSHRYKVEVLIQSAHLNQHGYLIDIVDLEQALIIVIEMFEEQILNEQEDFKGLNPSLERFARIFYRKLQQRIELGAVKMNIKLWENATDWAAYSE